MAEHGLSLCVFSSLVGWLVGWLVGSVGGWLLWLLCYKGSSPPLSVASMKA